MRKRFRLILIILLVAGLALVVLRFESYPKEPSYQGQPVSHWIKVLNNMTTDAQGMSYWEGDHPILEIGPPAIPYLIKALRKKDTLANKTFVALWPRLPASLRRKVPQPIPAALLRASAARGLGLFGPEAAVAVPDLIEALHDKDNWVRTAAASAFEYIGPRAKAATPELINGLNDPKMRLGCVIGLNGTGRESAEAVTAFQSLLSDPDNNIRGWAITGLGKMSVKHELAVKALEEALQNDDIHVRTSAAESLGQIGAAASAVPELLKALNFAEQHPNDIEVEIMFWKILESLEQMGPTAQAAVPALTNCMSSTNPMISVYAARALWSIEPHNALTIPCFIETLNRPDASNKKQDGHLESAQYWSLRALLKIGPEARAALPFVQRHVGPGDAQKDLAAAVAAWSLNPTNPPPINLLEKVYRSQAHIMNRRTAVEIMGDLGPAARPMIPILKEAAKEADVLMRKDARLALQKVELENPNAGGKTLKEPSP